MNWYAIPVAIGFFAVGYLWGHAIASRKVADAFDRGYNVGARSAKATWR